MAVEVIGGVVHDAAGRTFMNEILDLNLNRVLKNILINANMNHVQETQFIEECQHHHLLANLMPMEC